MASQVPIVFTRSENQWICSKIGVGDGESVQLFVKSITHGLKKWERARLVTNAIRFPTRREQ